MAGNTFKQQCPSCENGVTIRDVSFVGKKVECPKCKYRFVVEKPANMPTAPAESPKSDAAKPAASKPVPAKPSAQKPAAAPADKPKPGALQPRVEDDTPPPPAPPSKKKLYIGLGLGIIGVIVLAFASFMILSKPAPPKKVPFVPPPVDTKGMDEDDEKDKMDENSDDKTDDKTDEKKDEKKDNTTEKKPLPPPVVKNIIPLFPPGPYLTNLLPGDTEHVFHGFFKHLFDDAGTFRSTIAGDGRLLGTLVLKPRLGFGVAEIDDFLRADRFTDQPWTYTVIHLNTAVDEEAITKAFGLKAMPKIKDHTYYKATKDNPTFNQLSRVALGVPHWLKSIDKETPRTLYVRFHDPQTIIFADEAPLKALLQNDLYFPLTSGLTAPPPKVKLPQQVVKNEKPKEFGPLTAENLGGTVWTGKENRPGLNFGSLRLTFTEDGKVDMETPAAKSTGTFTIEDKDLVMSFDGNLKYSAKLVAGELKGSGQLTPLEWRFSAKPYVPEEKAVEPLPKGPGAAIERLTRSFPYLTIKVKLKEMLDRLEAKSDETPERVLYSTATELDAARVPNESLPAEYREKFIWKGKQVWDLTHFLEDRKPRIAIAGSALLQRDSDKAFQYRNDFDCLQEKDARELVRYSNDVMSRDFVRNFERYLKHKIETPKDEPPSPLVPIKPLIEVPKEEVSKWTATQQDQLVDIRIDLHLDNATLSRLQSLVGLLAFAARAEVDLAIDPASRQTLGAGVAALAQKGNASRGIAPGSFPPGTFPRPGNVPRGLDTPANRLSWMTTVLPFLGHDNVSQRIDWNASWRDPSNWLAGKTVIPEFIDPSYPMRSRHVSVNGLDINPATTHFVGIAGVGLDAGSLNRDDPANAQKIGVFGYDRSATLAEIQKGRGTGNTIMMMQIPYDGATGVSPWIAGGGATVRGVPEKNSLAPFVLTKDKDGKAIAQKGKAGTHVILADGSVKFLAADTPDEVVKALCAINAPAPKGDFFADETPAKKPAAVSAPETKTPAAVSAPIRPRIDDAEKRELAPLPTKVASPK
jgi:hypothetical protein